MTGGADRTQEAKRQNRAMPAPLETMLPYGCIVLLAAYVALCALWYAATRDWIPIAFALPVVLLLAVFLLDFLKGLYLLSRVMVEWAPRGLLCLIVHSNSPRWEDHIAAHWTPRIGAQAVTLNWSERSKRKRSLEFKLFMQFCGRRNFNPAVIVFRGLRHPLVFRFFYAFHEAAGGRPQYLERLEKQMFEALGV